MESEKDYSQFLLKLLVDSVTTQIPSQVVTW